MRRFIACVGTALLVIACIPDKSNKESLEDIAGDTAPADVHSATLDAGQDAGFTDTGETGTDPGDQSTASDEDTAAPGEDATAETTCVPDCHGKACGDDGCGGACGDCGKGEECAQGQCEAASCEGGYCMEEHPSGCSCAYGCEEAGDCCADFCDICPGTCAGNSCGELKYQGCCDGQFNTWCENGQLVTEDCGVNPLCGWNKNKQFHDCGTNGDEDPSGKFPKECK